MLESINFCESNHILVAVEAVTLFMLPIETIII